MHDTTNLNPKLARSPVDAEEKRAWVRLYKQVGRDAVLAAEVMIQLEVDIELKRRYLALYLCCKQTVRQNEARQSRDRRIGQWLGSAAHSMLISPLAVIIRAAQRALSRGADVLSHAVPATLPSKTTADAVDTTPSPSMVNRSLEARRNRSPEPAQAKVTTLLQDPEFSEAQAQFVREAGMSLHAGLELIPEGLDQRPAPRVAASGR